MKRSRFSDQQIAFVLRQADEGTAIAEVCREIGHDPLQLAVLFLKLASAASSPTASARQTSCASYSRSPH